MQTNDRQITDLMKSIDNGTTQLPDFQRGWVWDDNRIRALIASITNNFPVGAAMFLEYGNTNIRFKYRVIEGSPAKDIAPSELILDGQQRLTSIYSSLYNPNPVHTRTDKGRKDWEQRKNAYFNGDLLSIISATDFLTTCTLLSTYQKGGTVSCKKKDVLNLTLDEYQKYADDLTNGFVEAEKILQEERIFSSKDLPYSTQFIPLAVLCTILSKNNQIKTTTIKNKIKQWYWCGVFGEMYGSANETRYVLDVVGVMDWISDDTKVPKTVQDSYFNPTRLLSLQSRLSAAYKGIMALILKNHCQDFISGREMDFSVYKAENIDIHHIFPKDYCEKQKYDKAKWNSVINKTPITYSTNREIGGVAPSVYLTKIENKGQVSSDILDTYLTTHWIDVVSCRNDNFQEHIIKRAKMLLNAIEKATGKSISGRDSEDVVNAFGGKLS